MADIFKVVTLVGLSPKSHAEAIDNALAEAARTIRNLSWFGVKELRGALKDGGVREYQAIVEVGFKVER